jgi:hypothetical protein
MCHCCETESIPSDENIQFGQSFEKERIGVVDHVHGTRPIGRRFFFVDTIRLISVYCVSQDRWTTTNPANLDAF